MRPFAVKLPVAVVLLATLASCAHAPVVDRTLNDERLASKVLIATDKGAYKQLLVDKIVAGLKDRPCFIKVVGLDQLRADIGGDFDCLVIVNTCHAWSIDGRANGFIKATSDKGKVVLVTTSRTGWRPQIPGVDSMTAASKKHTADDVAGRVVAQVLKRLEQSP